MTDCPICNYEWEHSGQRWVYRAGYMVSRTTVPCTGPPSAFPMDNWQFENRLNVTPVRQHGGQPGPVTTSVSPSQSFGDGNTGGVGQHRHQGEATGNQQTRRNQFPIPIYRQAEQNCPEPVMRSPDTAATVVAEGRNPVALVDYETPATGMRNPGILVDYEVPTSSRQAVQARQPGNQNVRISALCPTPAPIASNQTGNPGSFRTSPSAPRFDRSLGNEQDRDEVRPKTKRRR